MMYPWVRTEWTYRASNSGVLGGRIIKLNCVNVFVDLGT